MNETILLPQDIADEGKKWLTDRGYRIKPGTGISALQIAEDVAGCSAIIARLGDFDKAVMEAEPKLRVIARHGAGYDNIDLAAARELGICVTYDPVSNTNAVAEHVIALLMACAKHLVRMDREVKNGNFLLRNQLLTTEVTGKTLGIVGYGRIGRSLAKKAGSGLGMEVIAFDPCVQEAEGARMAGSLMELLAQSDFVSLNLPATAETRHLFGAEVFKRMKPGAFLINAARGELVAEDALADALNRGLIAGAAIDVFEQEPPVPGSPLLSANHLIVSPHNAALTHDAMIRMALTAAKAVDDALSGRTPEFALTKPEFKMTKEKPL